MDILVGPSRGKCIEAQIRAIHEEHGIDELLCISRPGGKTSNLTDIAIREIRKSKYPRNNIVVYFFAGLPDITKLEKCGRYSEAVFHEETEEAVERFERLLHKTADRLHEHGVKICFCPIVPTNISKYNHHRLHTKKTNHLKHTQQYDKWQEKLHQTTVMINRIIVSLNKSNHIATPFVNRPVNMSLKKRPSSEAPRYKFSYNNMPDGCHPNKRLAVIWSVTLHEIIEKNRNRLQKPTKTPKTSLPKATTPEQGEDSPKRSWKTEKRISTKV